MVTVLVAILGLSLLVIVHEGGHYLAARAFGMRVTRFSIGFGPVLASWTPKGSPTTFQVCAIPFLAYVMISGMNPMEEVDPDDPELYPNKGVFARIVTIFGGPFANYIAASAMIFVVAVVGWPVDAIPTEPMVVDRIFPDTPAEKAKLQVGDVIREAHGRPIKNVEELIEVTKARANQPTVYLVERDGERLPPMTITPEKAPDGRGVIGVTAKHKTIYEAMPVGDAASKAFVYPFTLTVLTLEGIGHMIRERTSKGMIGPVGMAELVAEQADKGAKPLVFILIQISVALGFFNLLPFPALDGGRLVFLGYELVTRRRPNERIEAMVHGVGLLFMLGVIVLVTWRDLLKIFT